MAEDSQLQAGSDWLRGSKSIDSLPYVLSFQKNQKHIIRILDKVEPISVWRHTCRTAEGRFIKAYCCGDFENIKDKCPLCLINKSEKYRDLKGKDKPFPKSSEYVKVVWSYDDNKPMLLVGNDVWRRIDMVRAQGTDIFKYDIAVSRVDEENKPTTYMASALPERMAFDKVVDPAMIPSATTYVELLKNNLSKVPVTVPAASVAQGTTVAAQEEAKTVQVPANTATGSMLGAPTARRDELKAKFAALLNKGWNSSTAALISQLMTEINKRRKLMSAEAKEANDLDAFTDDEYESFIGMYEAGTMKK